MRLDRLAAAHGLRCNLLGKLECFNAAGSVKDRIALRMVNEAEAEGRLLPGKSVMYVPTCSCFPPPPPNAQLYLVPFTLDVAH